MKAAYLTLALVSIWACARPRNILEPVQGALSRTYADSARYVFDAAAYAVTDEGIGIVQHDRKRQYIESDWVDVATLRVPIGADVPQFGSDRVVRFQLRTERILGATRLIGEAIVRQGGASGGRANDRMVPANHPARAVLLRMFARVDERLANERERRARKAAERTAQEPPR